jgi:hypothetical protein
MHIFSLCLFLCLFLSKSLIVVQSFSLRVCLLCCWRVSLSVFLPVRVSPFRLLSLSGIFSIRVTLSFLLYQLMFVLFTFLVSVSVSLGLFFVSVSVFCVVFHLVSISVSFSVFLSVCLSVSFQDSFYI